MTWKITLLGEAKTPATLKVLGNNFIGGPTYLSTWPSSGSHHPMFWKISRFILLFGAKVQLGILK